MRQRRAPGFVEPMLLASGRELPSGDGWWAELNLDGARGQLRVMAGAPELRTRRGRRCDGGFPEIVGAAVGLPDVILDGEIVLLGDDGGPDFDALRARLVAGAVRARALAAARPAVFYAFDALWHQGSDLRGCPLVGRRRVLESLPLSGAVALVDMHPGQAATVLAFAWEHCSTLMIDVRRWLRGAPSFAIDLSGYRTMVINHEMGHVLGFDHMLCPGQPAPVMQTQTIALNGCTPNPYPFAADGKFISGPWAPS